MRYLQSHDPKEWRLPRVKICFITSCSLLGGAERILLETIDVLKESGVDCYVLLPGEGELARQLREDGVPYAFLSAGSWISWKKPSIWRRIKAAIGVACKAVLVAKQIRKWGCDIVYTNTLAVCGGSIAARLLGLPHIWHLQEFGREDHGVYYEFGEGFSNRAISALSSTCIVLSGALAEKYRRYIRSSKITIIYPSMHRVAAAASNASLTHGGNGRFRIVLVGGLAEGKGQTDAVLALATLVRAGVDAELVLVGDGDPAFRRILEDLAGSKETKDRVVFFGRVDNPAPMVRNSDVVVVCSRSEAFGRVTIEGMLAGKPVIGARSAATAELIRDGFNGLLYKTHDPLDLANKLTYIKDNPSIARRLAANGKQWAQTRFTRERYASELAGVISSITPVLQ